MVYIVAGLKSTAQMGAVDFKHTSLCVSEPLYPVPALTPCLSVCLSVHHLGPLSHSPLISTIAVLSASSPPSIRLSKSPMR